MFPLRNSSPVLSVAPWLKVIGLNIFREVPLHALLVSGTLEVTIWRLLEPQAQGQPVSKEKTKRLSGFLLQNQS